MWDKVTPEEQERREQRLKQSNVFFKSLMDRGATMARHDGTRDSALSIIQGFREKNDTIVAKIVDELVEEKKSLLDTEAGRSFKLNIVMLCRSTQNTYKH